MSHCLATVDWLPLSEKFAGHKCRSRVDPAPVPSCPPAFLLLRHADTSFFAPSPPLPLRLYLSLKIYMRSKFEQHFFVQPTWQLYRNIYIYIARYTMYL